MPKLFFNVRVLCLWMLVCLIDVNIGRNERRKSYSYQYVNRQFSNFGDGGGGDIDYPDFYDFDQDSGLQAIFPYGYFLILQFIKFYFRV